MLSPRRRPRPRDSDELLTSPSKRPRLPEMRSAPVSKPQCESQTNLDVGFPGPLAVFTDLMPIQPLYSNQPSSNLPAFGPHSESGSAQLSSTTPVPSGTKVQSSAVTSEPSAQDSSIRDAAQQIRLAMQEGLTKGKGTEKAYPRHVKNFIAFWTMREDDAEQADPSHIRVPVHPITPYKLALFLHHEINRPKKIKRGKPKEGTSVGQSHIKQVINAIQNYVRQHSHEPEYRDCPEIQIIMNMRQEPCVKIFETASAANEPTRVSNAHTVKAAGTVADTYEVEDLQQLSKYWMTFQGSKDQIYLQQRDRSMLLLSMATALRGDNIRQVLLSDLFTRQIPMSGISPDAKIMALIVLADQGKTNTNGRVENFGAFRHCLPELCAIGGLALYFFTHFHIVSKKVPVFAPDFLDPKHSEYGRRDWYQLHLFPGNNKAGTLEGANTMTYENHRDRLGFAHKQNNVQMSKVTHAARVVNPKITREHGASRKDAKSLGWKVGDVYSASYDVALPTPALLGAAMFNAQKQESYVLPRGHLEPPPNLMVSLFPWVEAEETAYNTHVQLHGSKARDYMLNHFLRLLVKLRTILLQDAVLLYEKYPDCPLWRFKPFNTEEFLVFARQSYGVLEKAKEEVRLHVQHLPATLAASVSGSVERMSLQLQQNTEQYQRSIEDQNQRMQFIEHLLLNQQSSKTRKTQVVNRSYALTPHCPSVSSSSSSRSITIEPQVAAPLAGSSSMLFACSSEITHNPLLPQSSPFGLQTMEATLMPLNCHMAPQLMPASGPNSSHWPDDLLDCPAHFTPLSMDVHEREGQISHARQLIERYGRAKVLAHTFEWKKNVSKKIACEWLPHYHYQKVTTITEVWEEWTNGLQGFFSIRQLDEGWNARWKRNISGLKTDTSRRKKIIDLIHTLSKKPNWNISLALNFLNKEYPIPSMVQPFLATLRSFVDHLQNTSTGPAALQSILSQSESFTN